MSLWPQSLFGRNALLIVTLMVLAQIGSALLVRALIVRPRTEQIADAVARNVAAVRAGLAALPRAERQAFVQAFQARSGAVATPNPGPRERLAAARLSPLERSFVRSVSSRLAGDATEVIWRRDADRGLALRLHVENDDYWLTLPEVLPPREFSGAWLMASAAAAALALLGALAIQRRLDRPLRALVGAAGTLGTGARPEPLAEDGPREIAVVARSFNALVERLATADRERALMLAGISHDLRTPLTKLRLGVEITEASVEPALAATMKRSIEEMDAIVGQFLAFARDDARDEPLRPTALDELAREAAAACADHGRSVAVEGSAVVAMPLRAELLRRALANLLENAFRHGAPPVVVRTGQGAGSAWIEVADAGPGIDAAEAEALKQPFRRASGARGGAAGSGLGLAIAERAARAHGGRLELSNAAPGGLRARLSLPVLGLPVPSPRRP